MDNSRIYNLVTQLASLFRSCESTGHEKIENNGSLNYEHIKHYNNIPQDWDIEQFIRCLIEVTKEEVKKEIVTEYQE